MRYQIRETVGHLGMVAGGNRPYGICVTVIDTLNCHHRVGQFTSEDEGRSQPGQRVKKRADARYTAREKARELCNRLNEELL